VITSILVVLILFLVTASVIILGFSRRRSVIVYLLALSLLLGPRIPLGQVTDMQRLDIRIDDLITFLMCLIALSLLVLKKTKFNYPTYMQFLILFIFVSLVSTVYAVSYLDFPVTSSALFWGKELSYISLCFTVPFFITKREEVVTLIKVVCAAMALNIAWLAYQILTNTKGQLINFIEYTPSYGFTLIGDFPSFQVASVYSYALILFTILYFGWKKNPVLLGLMLGSFVGLFATLSRSFIACTFLVIALMTIYVVFRRRALSIKNVIVVFAFVIVTLAAGLWIYHFLEAHDFPIFRLEASQTSHALTEVRNEGIWKPLWYSFLENPIIGYGKGSVFQLLGNFDEAHNYFLRILIETGVIGTAFFLLFLFYLLRTAFMLIGRTRDRAVYILALNMIMTTVVLCMVSMGQDGFYSSKLAIPFYMNVGLINLVYMKRRPHAASAPAPYRREYAQPGLGHGRTA